MTDAYFVEPCVFDCAEDFLDALDETSDPWRRKPWLFRGQNIDKPLLPSALRTPAPQFIESSLGLALVQSAEAMLGDKEVPGRIQKTCLETIASLQNDERHANLVNNFLEKHTSGIPDDLSATNLETLHFREFWRNHIVSAFYGMLELYMVGAFVELADKVGLVVPPDMSINILNRPYRFLDQLTSPITFRVGRNPATLDEHTSIEFALAQHHRVPTRLLDFTFRSLVAAYFAAHFDDGSSIVDASRQIVVWAINADALTATDLRVVKRRRSEIGFLQAQDGAFVLDTRANEKYWLEGRWVPAEYYLKDMIKSDMAYKFSLPVTERQNLLDILALKGVTLASLMPSFDNVRRQILGSAFDISRFVVTEA